MEPHWAGLATAVGVGLLVGVERESRNGDDDGPHVAGVRTFTLISLSGAMAALIGTPAIIAGAVFVGLAGIASYVSTHRHGPGLTTEVAMFATFLIGVLAMSEPALSAALGAGVALVLSAKTRLHAFIKTTLSARELQDGLLLLAAVLIVLPLLPDRALDPWGVFNLQQLWRLVVLVLLINAFGYIAQRALGPRLGLPISGLAGGFISATATIGAMASRAKSRPEERMGAIAGALLANLATVLQLAMILAALAPAVLASARYALLFSGIAAAILGGLAGWRAWHAMDATSSSDRGRAFNIRGAFLFVAVVAVILLVSALLSNAFGQAGAIAAAAFAGFADVHAPTASVAQLSVAGRLDLEAAMIAIALALVSNSVSKVVIALINGGRYFGSIMAGGLLVILACFFAGIWLSLSIVN